MIKQDQPKMQKYTLKQFMADFPDDDTCLEWLKNQLYPDGIHCHKCDRVTKHHKVAKRRSYSCDHCGNHVHPTADTIFHKSTTPLTLWFYAVYLMASTRCEISAKQLEREFGVTYKTAWRMFNRIRSMLADDNGDKLEGEVEVDESYFGGKRRGGKRGRGSENKKPVVGMVERKNGKGRVKAVKAENVKRKTVMPIVKERILPQSTVYTDELKTYDKLAESGYAHRRIHHASKIYVMGDAHTNTIEGFWSLVKRGIGGVYHAVSDKYLQAYLDEYSFRYSHRKDVTPMFRTFLRQIRKDRPGVAMPCEATA